MSKRIRSAIAMILTLVIVIGLVPAVPVSAAADTSAVGQVVDSFTANSSTFTLSTASRLFVVGDSAPAGELLQTLQLVQRQFAADSIPTSNTMDIVWDDASYARAGDILIYLDAASGIAAEGYKIAVTDRAAVTASDVDGLLYGLNMLQKHLRAAGSNSIQGFTAADAPDTVQRAVSLDCGRKYYTKDWICNFIREMSWMGYNTLEMHFSDDSGFRIDIWDEKYYTGDFQPVNDFSWICGSNYTSWTLSAYQNDVDKGKYLTTAEVIEILQTAAEYHIDVIPAFDSPSHLDYMTWKYEQNYKSNSSYSFYSTYNNKTYYASDVKGIINYTNSSGWSTPLKWPYYSTVNVKGEQAKAFIFELYIDIANFFKEYSNSTDFSIGADEVNLNTANLASGYSFTWGFSDFVSYINELNTLLNDMGYTMRMYNDFMGSTSYSASNYEFADNIEILYWDSPFNPSASSNTNHTQPVSYWVNDGRILYNCIQTNTYYALRKTSGGSDARSVNNRQWTFYHSDEQSIYNEWYSADISEHGDYSEDVADVPAAQLGGAYFLIWGDYACVSTEAEIWNGCYDTSGSGEYYSLLDRMWSNITKMWNWDINSSLSFTNFKTVRDGYGDFPGLVSCSVPAVLPAATAAECADHAWIDGVCADCGNLYDFTYDAEDSSALGVLIDSYAANDTAMGLTANSRFFIVTNVTPSDALQQTVELAQRQFAADGVPTAEPMQIVWGDVSYAKAGDILIELDASSGIAAEGYSVAVTDRAVVTASDVDGMLYGLNMLLKHFRAAGSNIIKGFTAADAPDTAERTVHLDCGRKYLTKEWICNFIREMSWMGYNTLEMHFSEDGGFRLDLWDEEYFVSPNGNDFSWACGSREQYWCYDVADPDKGKYLTTAEVVEILQTAVEYHIDVIPSFDTPAHVDWMTWQYYNTYKTDTSIANFNYDGKSYTLGSTIHYRHSADGTFSSDYKCLDLGNDTVQKFAFAMYADIAAFFKQYAGSVDFNICGDEVALKSTDTWNYADFYNYVNDLNGLLKEQGYTVRMYNDFLDRTTYSSGLTMPALDSDIEIIYWTSPANSSSNLRPSTYFLNQGRTVYNGLNYWTYYALRIFNTPGYSGYANWGKDARDPSNTWWAMYYNEEQAAYEQWNPSRLSQYGSDSYTYTGSQLGGGYFMIWCDYAGLNTEQELWDGTWDNTNTTSKGKYFYSMRQRMWSNITKMWNWDINSSVSFSSFETLRDTIGDFPGLVDCSVSAALPASVAGDCVGHVWNGSVCSNCGTVCDHDYTAVYTPATCLDYASTSYSCGLCGHSYTEVDAQWSDWSATVPEGVDERFVETKTQYRYSDYETTTSFEDTLEGYTQIGSQWAATNTGSVKYVNSWPSGFSTSSSLYAQYNQKANKVTAYETDTAKRVINSDALCGYLYYHWCYYKSYYSVASKSGSYTTFHAYYSTIAPSNYTCDYSDYSYCTNNDAVCSTNSEWYFVAYVYEQKYTDYQLLYTHERWGDWSEWDDTPVSASATRTVETQTQYRYLDGEMGGHAWENGACATCGAVCAHTYQNNVCTACGMEKPVMDYYLFGYINGADYADKEDSENLGEYKFVDGSLVVFFTEDSYVGVKASDNLNWYMTDGWQGYVSSVTLYNTGALGENGDKLFIPGGTEVTFTLTDNGDDTYVLSYVAVECPHESHSTEGVCTVCGDAVEHAYGTNGFCVCGLECDHAFESGVCAVCGKECAHIYQNNVCTICGNGKPVYDYYLFGYINGANYACEGDGENLGEYKFVDGQVVVLFSSDSYVAVKASDNAHWYMTAGWQGQVTSATLYNTTTLSNADKLFVPGGMEVTFSLVDNGDDTYVLSYEATCAHQSHDQDGVCADCGVTVGHSLKNNVCSVCGYEKLIQDLHLFGWINGQNYGCESDWENLGVYKFVDGKLVAFFNQDTYIGVKSADNLNWYMTDGYLGQVTSATLVNSDSILTEDKMFIPGNLKITFTLVDNGDDTYVLSYEAVECPHDEHSTNGICTLCGSAVEHSYVEGVCGCGHACGHSYVSGVCSVCGMNCEHSWTDGACTICGSVCGHSWTDGTCTICGSVCGHSWIDGACSVCGSVCGHSWTDGSCSVCGTVCSHTYRNNICTTCGFAKPAVDYYLFGSINGADYAWGEDAANLGQYLFVDGALVVTFRQDSTVGVKASNNHGWYMTDGDQGDAVSVVLYNTAVITNGALLSVPGGMKITFTLVDNGDDTLTLSYTGVPCAHESHDQTGACTDCGTVVEHSYDSVVTAPACTEGGYTTYTCGVCGDSYTADETSALGHSYDSVVTAPACTEGGYTTYTCGVCGDSYTADETAALGHSYVDGVCTGCGEADPDYVKPVTPPTLNLVAPTLNFREEIMYNIYYTAENLDDVVEMGLITFGEYLPEGTMDDALDVVSGYSLVGSNYMVHTNGIPAKMLSDTVYFRVYAKLTDGSYVYSQTAAYHAVAYAQDILANSTSDNMKSLVVAMLNYGTAAQLHFGYKTDALMNACLTDEQKGLVDSYSSDMVTGLTAVDSTKVGSFAATSGSFGNLLPSVAFEGAFAINYYFTPIKPMDGDLTLYYWSLDDYNAAEELTAENATGSVVMTPSGIPGEYWAMVEGIAAKQIDQTVFVAGVYESGGVTCSTGVLAYSLAAYCLDRIQNGSETMRFFAAETIVYGYYAKNYFANL